MNFFYILKINCFQSNELRILSMLILDKKVLLVAISSAFFSFPSSAMNPEDEFNLHLKHILSTRSNAVSQDSIDSFGRHPGHENYGAPFSDAGMEEENWHLAHRNEVDYFYGATGGQHIVSLPMEERTRFVGLSEAEKQEYCARIKLEFCFSDIHASLPHSLPPLNIPSSSSSSSSQEEEPDSFGRYPGHENYGAPFSDAGMEEEARALAHLHEVHSFRNVYASLPVDQLPPPGGVRGLTTLNVPSSSVASQGEPDGFGRHPGHENYGAPFSDAAMEDEERALSHHHEVHSLRDVQQ